MKGVHRGQRGFTLVEIMVSLVVSALLVGMILSLFGRMSMAYRGQQGVAELQQILAAAQGLIERDLRQAGLQVPNGFFIANDTFLHQPVEVVNDAYGNGTDELRVYYADTGAQARVVTFTGNVISVDNAGDFVPGDVVVVVRGKVGTKPSDTVFYACVAQVETKTATVLNLDGAGRWGNASNSQCAEVRPNPTETSGTQDTIAMVYRFRARAYRIDPNRRDLSVLQMSPTAGFDNDWQDLAVGFTDLQVASRWNDTLDTTATGDTVDLDTDGLHEWYSDITQTALSNPLTVKTGLPVYQFGSYKKDRPIVVGVRVSLVVRTHTKIDTVPSQRTPKLQDDARPGNNDIGDHDSIQLEGVADSARPLELRGNHIYRYATFGADLRNLGIGI